MQRGAMAKRRAIQTEEAPKAIGPYSQAVHAGPLIFISGQIPLDPKSGDLVRGDTGDQTRRILDNIRAVLQAEGLGMDAVVKTTIFLRDMGRFNEVNAIYSEYFTDPWPAPSTVEVSRLPRDVDIEIEAIALSPEEG